MKHTILVAGLPRCGLSLTMQMLHAGGVACLGPHPSFEPFEIGRIPWLSLRDSGVAVKLVDPTIQVPPSNHPCRIISLSRKPRDQADSMLRLTQTLHPGLRLPEHRRIVASIRRDQKAVDRWALRQLGSSMRLTFQELVEDAPGAVDKICRFLGRELDREAMIRAVIPRTAEVSPEFLELKLIADAIEARQ